MVRIASHNSLLNKKHQLLVSSSTIQNKTIKYITKCNSTKFRRCSVDNLISENKTALQLASHSKHVTAKQNQMYLITVLSANVPQQSVLSTTSNTNLSMNNKTKLEKLNNNNKIHINRVLPKELILRIFSYLDIISLCRCAQICSFWNKLAMDGSNWQEVDLFHFQKEIRASVVENLANRCGGFLKVLSLKGCENVHDSAMRLFASKCHNIEKLSLSNCKLITDATCECIGRYCHRLKQLDLENCTAITNLTLIFLSNGCKRLEELNISWCENITNSGIAYITKGCPNLISLICKGCDGLTSNCFAHLGNNYLNKLKKLNLLGCVNIMDETIKNIVQHCRELESLCLSNCREITDESLNSIALNCPKIRDLELASCINLTDTGFIMLSKHCHNLERIDMEDCSLITDATILNLKNGCPNLSSLALSHCENLTDNGLIELCNSHRERLEILELDNCPNISDSALDSMKVLQKLERIDLYDCQMITKEGIHRFKQIRPEVNVHAYFAPATPSIPPPSNRNGIRRCCAII